jgi:multiple sugar transport system ATP-binding protein
MSASGSDTAVAGSAAQRVATARVGKPAANVVLERVVKRYEGGVVAVKSIDLAIKAGEFVVLVGPSGCGKTTTLRMIAGLEDITEGTLKIGERVMNDVAPRDRDIAMVFQSYALYPHMTVRENMAFGLELRKMPKDEIAARVAEAAKTLGLSDLLERKPKALSGGQRQRVAMGRAIVRQPSVFLFDEPLSNLDAKLRVQMRLEIASLHRRVGATMVYVTHDQVEAMTLADRIAVMSMGELQQFDTPMNVYLKPRNKFVAGFIGSPAMNFIEGALSTEGGRATFTCPGLALPLSDEHAARLSGRSVTGPVTLGVRPQHLHRGDVDQVGSGKVIHVELMGTESFVHLEVVDGERQMLVARLPGDQVPAIGAILPLTIERGWVHLFDASGVNVTLP